MDLTRDDPSVQGEAVTLIELDRHLEVSLVFRLTPPVKGVGLKTLRNLLSGFRAGNILELRPTCSATFHL